MRLISSGVPRADYYDRNPSSEGTNANTLTSEATGSTEDWSYTVPSAKKAFIGWLQAFILGVAAPSTTTNSDQAGVIIQLTPSGGSARSPLQSRGSSVVIDADYVVNAFGAPTYVLQAGDKLASQRRFDGTAAGTGRAFMGSGMARTEFDA